MKEKLKKIVLTILAVMMAFNGIISFDGSAIVQAQSTQTTTVNDSAMDAEFNKMDENSKNFGSELADALLGIVLYIPKIMTFAIVSTVKLIVSLISALDQDTGAGSVAISIESILFNVIIVTR